MYIHVFEFAFEQCAIGDDFTFGIDVIGDTVTILINARTINEILHAVAKDGGAHAPVVALQFVGNVDIL